MNEDRERLKKEIISLSYPKNRIDEDKAKLYNLRKKVVPEFIYKYCNFEVKEEEKKFIPSLKNLENNSVWMSNPNDFNDPYDCHFYLDEERSMEHIINRDIKIILDMKINSIFGNVEKKNIINSQSPYKTYLSILDKKSNIDIKKIQKKIHDDRLKEDIKRIKNKFRIVSFSETNTSILMWSHYADNHKGFCVKYNTNDDNLIWNLYPIIYTNEFFDITNYILEKDFHKPYILQSVFRKHLGWEYEEEWRIVAEVKSPIIGWSYPMPKPIAIYMGVGILPKDKEELKRICNKKNILLYQMRLNDEKFELIPELVSHDKFDVDL